MGVWIVDLIIVGQDLIIVGLACKNITQDILGHYYVNHAFRGNTCLPAVLDLWGPAVLSEWRPVDESSADQSRKPSCPSTYWLDHIGAR